MKATFKRREPALHDNEYIEIQAKEAFGNGTAWEILFVGE